MRCVARPLPIQGQWRESLRDDPDAAGWYFGKYITASPGGLVTFTLTAISAHPDEGYLCIARRSGTNALRALAVFRVDGLYWTKKSADAVAFEGVGPMYAENDVPACPSFGVRQSFELRGGTLVLPARCRYVRRATGPGTGFRSNRRGKRWRSR